MVVGWAGIGGWGVGCTFEMSCPLGGEVSAAVGPKSTKGVLTPSRWCSEGGGRALNISGKVECVALQFGKGDGRMLQVIEQHLDLSRDTTRTLITHSSYAALGSLHACFIKLSS